MSTFDELAAAAMSEADLARRVEGLLRFYGWRWFHAPDNKPRAGAGGRAGRQRITPGFPDYVAIRRLAGHGPELLIAELKAERGRYGPGQREWLADFEAIAAAVDALENPGHPADLPAIGVYTWRPGDLLDGTIERVLAGPAGADVPVD